MCVCLPLKLHFLHSHRTRRQVKASAAKQSIQSGGFHLVCGIFDTQTIVEPFRFCQHAGLLDIYIYDFFFSFMAELDEIWSCAD